LENLFKGVNIARENLTVRFGHLCAQRNERRNQASIIRISGAAMPIGQLRRPK